MEWMDSLWQWLQDGWLHLCAAWQALPWRGAMVWTLTGILLLVGLLGTVIPFLPGPLIILVAAITHTLLLPEAGLSTLGFVVISLLFILAYGIDFASGLLGARWFGASRWGLVGVLLGGIIGLFFGLPGLILGPLVGAFAFEMAFAGKRIRPAIRSTWGTLLGGTIGLIARVFVALVMTAYFLWETV